MLQKIWVIVILFTGPLSGLATIQVPDDVPGVSMELGTIIL